MHIEIQKSIPFFPQRLISPGFTKLINFGIKFVVKANGISFGHGAQIQFQACFLQH